MLTTLYNAHSFKHERYRPIVAFLHCFTGCDTGSAYAGKGKITSVFALISFPEISEFVNAFYLPSADHEVLRTLMKALYKCQDQEMSR